LSFLLVFFACLFSAFLFFSFFFFSFFLLFCFLFCYFLSIPCRTFNLERQGATVMIIHDSCYRRACSSDSFVAGSFRWLDFHQVTA